MSVSALGAPTPATAVAADARPVNKQSSSGEENRAGWLFAAPFLTLYILFLIGPVLIGILISLFNTTTVKSGLGSFVGLSNYSSVLSNGDFWTSMWHSVLFTLLTTPLLIALPLLFAILASRLTRNRRVFRTAVFAPYGVPPAAVVPAPAAVRDPGVPVDPQPVVLPTGVLRPVRGAVLRGLPDLRVHVHA